MPRRSAAVVVEQQAALEVLGVDRRRAVVHQAAEAVVGALEVGLGLPARLDVGAHLDLGHHRLREVLEDRDLLGLPGARRVVGDAQRAEHEAAGEPQRDAGVGERLAGLHDREVLGQVVLARVVDDQRLRRGHDVLAERVLDRRAAGLGEVGRPDAAERVQVRVVEQRHHRDRRADERGGEVREPVEGVGLLIRRAGRWRAASRPARGRRAGFSRARGPYTSHRQPASQG